MSSERQQTGCNPRGCGHVLQVRATKAPWVSMPGSRWSRTIRASLVAAILAGVLSAAGCSSPSAGPHCPPGAPCREVAPFRVTFAMTVNGRSAELLAAVWASRPPPTFSVGQNLASLVPQQAPPGVATTAAMHATITIGANPLETFAPAPSSAAPALTAYQAWLRFAGHVGSHRTSMPPGVTARLGLFTMAAGPAAAPGTSTYPKSHGEAYIALNQLVYGYSSHSCPPYQGRMPGMPPPPPTPCIEWLFLNANTGHMIIETWQQ